MKWTADTRPDTHRRIGCHIVYMSQFHEASARGIEFGE